MIILVVGAEHVRSIHMFKKGGYIHMIQQEFLSKGWYLKQMSAPTHLACLSNEAHVKAYMDMVRAKQETESWKCLLDFCTSPPRCITHPLLSHISPPKLRFLRLRQHPELLQWRHRIARAGRFPPPIAPS